MPQSRIESQNGSIFFNKLTEEFNQILPRLFEFCLFDKQVVSESLLKGQDIIDFFEKHVNHFNQNKIDKTNIFSDQNDNYIETCTSNEGTEIHSSSSPPLNSTDNLDQLDDSSFFPPPPPETQIFASNPLSSSNEPAPSTSNPKPSTEKDVRSDLLAAIRSGIKLNRIVDSRPREKKKSSPPPQKEHASFASNPISSPMLSTSNPISRNEPTPSTSNVKPTKLPRPLISNTIPSLQEDARSVLLASIKKGINLKRVEDSEKCDKKKSTPLNDMASILVRRVGIEFSDSEEAAEEFDDSDAWDDERHG